jgi:hypothetical protein
VSKPNDRDIVSRLARWYTEDPKLGRTESIMDIAKDASKEIEFRLAPRPDARVTELDEYQKSLADSLGHELDIFVDAPKPPSPETGGDALEALAGIPFNADGEEIGREIAELIIEDMRRDPLHIRAILASQGQGGGKDPDTCQCEYHRACRGETEAHPQPAPGLREADDDDPDYESAARYICKLWQIDGYDEARVANVKLILEEMAIPVKRDEEDFATFEMQEVIIEGKDAEIARLKGLIAAKGKECI